MKALYTAAGNPVISVDAKKKELTGNLFRDGKVYTIETVEVYDHDFPSLAKGVAVPHTLYDTERNEAYTNIGTSRDTSEFACDPIRHWWHTSKWNPVGHRAFPPYYPRIIRHGFNQPAIYL